ncbi:MULTISPECIES: cobalt-precorrin-6A reductase [Actinomycetes]|uniref:cobalt-precorrin-6A reductase n=1 Tax=Actinomycetes TaxID=1760 RepID=UPI0004BE4934|nr:MULTISPECIES: cobalt-precorrin-6A reductase [Actinomycetes]
MSGPVLILGGTAEARALAEILDRDGIPIITSLAGRVQNPALPRGKVRIGGFGGVNGLLTWLREQQCIGVVDATHPFARKISASAAAATMSAGLPLLSLRRPPWQPQAGDHWLDVPDIAGAAAKVAEHADRQPGLRVFLTTGRQDVDVFAHIENAWFLIRLVDPPERETPPQNLILRNRGPYTLEGERKLLHEHRVDVIVTKNSGGDLVRAKLDAARELELPVVMVQRPVTLTGTAVERPEDAARWVRQRVLS